MITSTKALGIKVGRDGAPKVKKEKERKKKEEEEATEQPVYFQPK